MSRHTGAMPDRLGDVGLADTGLADDADVLPLVDEAAGTLGATTVAAIDAGRRVDLHSVAGDGHGLGNHGLVGENQVKLAAIGELDAGADAPSGSSFVYQAPCCDEIEGWQVPEAPEPGALRAYWLDLGGAELWVDAECPGDPFDARQNGPPSARQNGTPEVTRQGLSPTTSSRLSRCRSLARANTCSTARKFPNSGSYGARRRQGRLRSARRLRRP